jgi:DNA-binding CsgD family transcriptional regulator
VNAQPDARLFESIALADWLPDETLFSWASRYHLVSCNRLASATTQALFGHKYLGSAHDFPARIDTFVARTQGSIGSAATLIQDRTLLPFFLPFNYPSLDVVAIDALRGASTGSLKFRLGLLTSHFRAHFPLKACIDCMAEDRQRFGLAYWHRPHQLPGAWLCLKHNRRLSESLLKATGAKRFGWTLPVISQLRTMRPEQDSDIASDARTALRRLSMAANSLCCIQIGWHFHRDVVAKCHLARLTDLGLVTGSGRLKPKDLGQSFYAFASNLASIDEFRRIAPDVGGSTTQVTGFLYRADRITHPLRHLLMIAWLYESWDDFMSTYEHHLHHVAYPLNESGPAGPPSLTGDQSLRESCIKLAQQEGATSSAIAKQLKVTVATVMAHLTAAGVQPKRRPKLLDSEKQARLHRLLRQGAVKAEVAQDIGISIGTVTRFLLTEVGLHEQWRAVRFKHAQTHARSTWSKLLSLNPTATIKLLRAISPEAYAWLYRNDRAWLTDTNSLRPTPKHIPKSPVDWQARDQALCARIQSSLVQADLARRGSRMSVPELIQFVPELKAYLNQLSRLPMTQRELAKITYRRNRKIDKLLFQPD